MFSTIGNLVADSVVAVSLLSATEAIAASTVLTVALGGLVLLAWLNREPIAAQEASTKPNFRKAA